MRLKGKLVVVSFDTDRLSAVWGAIRKEHVRVEGWLQTPRPADVDAADAAQVGRWLRSALKEAGCGVGACAVAIPRASVVLKRLTFPALETASEGDLANMVQFQMARQLTMPLQGAAIDFVRLDGPEPVESGAAGQTEVFAAALPGEHVAWCRGVAKAARLSLRSVALRGEGSAALFAQLSYTQDGPILGISVSPLGVELGVVHGGRVVFSRAADLAPPASVAEWSEFTQRVAVEAKRTRVGYRGTGEGADLACVAVLGDDSLAAEVGRAVGGELDLPWHSVRFPGAVELPTGMDNASRASMAPLIGLMLGAAIDRPTYDFANPRQAPDTAAPLRQAALAAVLGLIVFGGGGWLIGAQRLSGLSAQVDTAKQQALAFEEEYTKQLRTIARVEHLQARGDVGVDWVSHLAYLSAAMPPRSQARLDSIDGVLESEVLFEKKDGGGRASTLAEGSWAANQVARFNLAGRVESREIANEFRARMIASKIYRAETVGADVASRFNYVLRTPLRRAEEPAAEGVARTEGGAP